jgi:hypothetical protein
MDHAEVHAWLEEAFFRPGVLRRLDEAVDDPALSDVRRHLAECSSCAEEHRSLRATAVALDVGFGPPPAERTLDSIRSMGRRRSPEPAPAAGLPAAGLPAAGLPAAGLPAAGFLTHRLAPLSAAAAALALVVVALAAGLLLGSNWATQTAVEGPRLARAMAVAGELWREPGTQNLTLRDTGGQAAGFVLYSPTSNRIAVVATGLSEPEAEAYECYLQRAGGQRLDIGPMHFEDVTAFWAGPMTDAADGVRPHDRFLVALDEDAEAVLWADF